MTSYFFDSSGLVKRYIYERGTAFVRQITATDAGNTIIIAAITSVEVASALRRREREGYLTPSNVDQLLHVLERHIAHSYIRLALSDVVINRATALLAAYPLRAYDAVQLASADISHAHLMQAGQPPLTFVSADDRLAEAAAALGLVVENPNSHR